MPTYTPPIQRRNHGRGHSYVDANGIKVPGVTTIIGDGVPKPALVPWAAGKTAEYAVDNWDELSALPVSERFKRMKAAPYADRNAAAAQGTRVHKLAVPLLHGKEIAVPQELRPYVEGYVRFLDVFDVRPILSEFVVVSHTHGIAGTGDLLTDLGNTDDAVREAWPEIPDDVLARLLIDIKTARKGVYGDVALQLAGYRYADVYIDEYGNEQPVPAVHGCGVVWLPGDGDFKLVPVTAGRAQYRSLLYAQQVADFVATSRDLVGEPVTPPLSDEAAYNLQQAQLDSVETSGVTNSDPIKMPTLGMGGHLEQLKSMIRTDLHGECTTCEVRIVNGRRAALIDDNLYCEECAVNLAEELDGEEGAL